MSAFIHHPPITSMLRRLARALPVLAGLGLLFTAPVQAQTYVSHPELTPYQLVSKSGKCVQGQYNATLFFMEVKLGTCSASENLQKFYLLHESSDDDVAPQLLGSEGVRMRIVLAERFDDITPTPGQYRALMTDHQALVHVNLSRDLAEAQSAGERAVWNMVRVPNPDHEPEMTVIALENDGFRVVGERTVYYGVPGRMVSKLVRGFAFPAGFGFPCTNAFFGQDPAFGLPKACFLATPIDAPTPFQVKFVAAVSEDGLHAIRCLAQNQLDTHDVTVSRCHAPGPYAHPDDANFTLRPTSYPK